MNGDPVAIYQLMVEVCEDLIENYDVNVFGTTLLPKLEQIITFLKPKTRSKITPEMLAVVMNVINNSDFLAVVGGKEQDLVNQEGKKPAVLGSAFVGSAELYNFGNMIGYLCMEGAKAGFATHAVDFLKLANQFAIQGAPQLPTAKPKIEIVS